MWFELTKQTFLLERKEREACSSDRRWGSHQEHAESLSHDAVEEVEGGVSSHHEEVRQEEVFSAAVVEQSVVLAAKQRLIGILWRARGRVRPQTTSVAQIGCTDCS